MVMLLLGSATPGGTNVAAGTGVQVITIAISAIAATMLLCMLLLGAGGTDIAAGTGDSGDYNSY